MEHIRRILVAIDLGESSREALAEARELWDRSGGMLHVLCVVQDPFALPWATSAGEGLLSTLSTQMERDARAYLADLLSPEERERYHCELAVRRGRRPSDEILAYASENHIDLIVLGRGDHTNPELAAEMGSVATAVVRRAACAVLIVPGRSARAERRHEPAQVHSVLR
jgi:nucleotide-binding universal stress UspA family protein